MKKNKNIISNIIVILISIFLILPIVATFLNSVFIDYATGIPRGFTLQFYSKILFGEHSIIPYLFRTIAIALIPTLLICFLLLMGMCAINLYYPKLDKYLNILSKIPYGIQGVILAVALISLYSNSHSFLSNRVFLLIGSYCVLVLPYMYQGIKNVMTTIEIKPIMEAAELLGANKLYTFFRIIVPSISRGLLATLLLSLGILMGDFVLVNLIASNYFETLGIYLSKMIAVSGHLACTISVIMFCLMFILSFLLQKLNKEKNLRR